jgi:hypothetical protein
MNTSLTTTNPGHLPNPQISIYSYTSILVLLDMWPGHPHGIDIYPLHVPHGCSKTTLQDGARHPQTSLQINSVFFFL